MKESEHTKGVILLVTSAIVFSTAGLFTKGVEASAWDVIFWRGVFAAAFTTAFVWWRNTLRPNFLDLQKPAIFVALLGAAGTAAFIPAFKLSTVANVALIYAAAPVFAAILAWVWLGERIRYAVGLGIVLSFTGVLVIVLGSLGQINLYGDLLALWMTLAISIMIVVYRRFPSTATSGPAVYSSLLLLPPALIWGNPAGNSYQEIAILAAFGLVFAVASVTAMEGAKRVASGEAALLSLIETPLAPLFAWFLLSEVPPLATFVGGLFIVAGVLGSQWGNKTRPREIADDNSSKRA